MHRATPSNTSFRAFSAGGTRTCIHSIDDTKQMQEMGGNMMASENRSGVESPQNYGFTSVVHGPDMDGGGSVTDCAEGFMNFMGGNRSFPVCSVMDDRRHRLNGCQPGDTAMFRGKDDNQQFHMTQDGGFWSADQSKTVRMQLVQSQQPQQQGGQQQAAQQQKGQKPVYKQGWQNSTYYVDVTSSKTTASGQEVHLKLADKNTYVHLQSANVYLGGQNSSSAVDLRGEQVDTRSGNFLRVMLEDGSIAKNVWALIGGGGGGGGGGSGGSGLVSGSTLPLQIQNGVMSLLHGLPLSTDINGVLQMLHAAPLSTDVNGVMQLLHAAPLSLSATATRTAGTLGINFAAPLMLDGSNNLTSSIKEAPQDGGAYGRLNAAWSHVLPLAGGQMTGILLLQADPTAPLGACTKQYTDARAWQEAPQDGYSYGRVNATWGRVLTGNQTIVLSGDASGSGTTAITTTLATVNANAGTFQGLTVNGKGLVTAAVIQNYTRWVLYTGPPQSFAKGDLTRDGDWTMIANKATSDRPAPQETGPEEDLLPAWTPATPNARASYTLYNEWTVNHAGWINQYGVDILVQNVGATHAVTLQINGTTRDTFSAVPNTAGGFLQDIAPIVVTSGAVIRVTLQVTQVANNQMYWEQQAGLFATAPNYCSLAQGSKDGAAADTTAYGCHLMFIPGTASPDWDIVAFGGSAGGGGSGGVAGIPDAPSDGTLYGRQNAGWLSAAPLASPALIGTPTAPTQTAGNNSTALATTAFVAAAIAAGTAGVTSWNTRTGAVTLALADVTGVGGAPLASPALTGAPTSPTPGFTDNSTAIATTAYVKGQNFLTSNQPITLSGDVTGSGTIAITTSIPVIDGGSF